MPFLQLHDQASEHFICFSVNERIHTAANVLFYELLLAKGNNWLTMSGSSSSSWAAPEPTNQWWSISKWLWEKHPVGQRVGQLWCHSCSSAPRGVWLRLHFSRVHIFHRASPHALSSPSLSLFKVFLLRSPLTKSLAWESESKMLLLEYLSWDMSQCIPRNKDYINSYYAHPKYCKINNIKPLLLA